MKKIISVMAALMFAAMLFNINVSAMTKSMYEREFMELVGQYNNGYISYDEFVSRSEELTEVYEEANQIDDSGTLSDIAQNAVNTCKDITVAIGNAVTTAGDVVKDWIDDVINPYATTEDVSSTDLQGYGALAIFYPYSNEPNMVFYYYTSTYGTYEVGDNGFYTIHGHGSGKRDYYYNGSFNSSTTYNSGYNWTGYYAKFYGDWRTESGDEQLPTDDEYTTQNVYDFTNTTDSEIDDLLQQLMEMLKRQSPDLSSVEGLLESIYFRLGELDKDNDNGLLSAINASIVALAQDGQAQNLALISKLDELKEALKEDATEIDLSEITKELKKISAGINGLAAIEVAENLLELTEAEEQLFNEWANLIPVLVDKVGLAVVSGTMSDIEVIIFTTSAPSDLNINLLGDEYTLLSTDVFSSDEIMDTVNTIKTFISVILLYVWCIRMRRLLI